MNRTSDTLLEAARSFEAGDYDAAVRLFEQMIVLSPESAELWHNLGQAYWGAKNLVSAADAYDKAPNVILQSTHINTLETIPLAILRHKALDVN